MMNSLNLTLYEKHFICPFILNDSFAGYRRNTPRHIIITLPKIKDKERILEAARKKKAVTYKGVPIRLSADC